MMPEFNAWGEVAKFAGALTTVMGAMAWFRKDSAEEDKVVGEAADVLISGVSDADKVSKIDLHTGKNLRDQMTVEEAEKINREGELRRFGWRRN